MYAPSDGHHPDPELYLNNNPNPNQKPAGLVCRGVVVLENMKYSSYVKKVTELL